MINVVAIFSRGGMEMEMMSMLVRRRLEGGLGES
jgi:hypothetical protein